MKIEITKKQEIINDEAKEVCFDISLDREYKTTWRTPTNLISVELFLDEMTALRDKLSEVIERVAHKIK